MKQLFVKERTELIDYLFSLKDNTSYHDAVNTIISVLGKYNLSFEDFDKIENALYSLPFSIFSSLARCEEITICF